MINVAGPFRTRVAGLMLALAVSLLLASGLGTGAAFASPGTTSDHSAWSQSSTAHASIVNGKSASIKDWPWQVAIAISRHVRPGLTPQERAFCGGSLIAPNLVVTAGHCVADVKRSKVTQMSVISGRTHLNNRSAGKETDVLSRFMPTYSSGRRKFSNKSGAADWDVALLKLSHPLSDATIKLAGTSEEDSWKTGQLVKTTGWGITRPNQRLMTNGLRIASQVMQPEKICQSWDGKAFVPSRMVCFGAASANSSACSGDSGGPLMAPVASGLGTEYRLVGLTSYGDGNCRGGIPSVDSRVAGQPMRGWVKNKAMSVTGLDVVGQGGVAPAVRKWCKVPNLFGFSLSAGKSKLRSNNCKLGNVYRDIDPAVRKGSLTYTNYLSHWLAKPGARITVGRNR